MVRGLDLAWAGWSRQASGVGFRVEILCARSNLVAFHATLMMSNNTHVIAAPLAQQPGAQGGAVLHGCKV